MTKLSKSEAAGKALDELDVGTTESDEESTDEGEESEVSASESEGAEESQDESSDEPEESEEPEEEAEEESDEESDDESVQSVADASVRRAFERAVTKHGRQDAGEGEGGYEGLRDKLLTDLKNELTGKKGGAQDIKDVDTKDPVAVQKYVDSRIETAVSKALQPLIKAQAEKEANLELAQFARDHKDGWKYGKAIAKLIGRNPNLTLDEAYLLASRDNGVQKGKKEILQSMKKKKGANLSRGTVKGKVETSTSKPVKSIRQAILAGLEETGATFGDT